MVHADSCTQVGLAGRKPKRKPSDACTAGHISHEEGAAQLFLPPNHNVFSSGPKFALLLCFRDRDLPIQNVCKTGLTVKRMKGKVYFL